MIRWYDITWAGDTPSFRSFPYQRSRSFAVRSLSWTGPNAGRMTFALVR